MLIVLAPLAILAVIAAVLVLAFKPRGASAGGPPVASDPRGMRTVAAVDAPPDAALDASLHDALRARGARVEAIEHEYARELVVTLGTSRFRVSVGFVGDPGEAWKVFVDDLQDDEGSRVALRAVHDALLRGREPARVHWASRESEQAGAPEWKRSPLDS